MTAAEICLIILASALGITVIGTVFIGIWAIIKGTIDD
jgi:hypothetical protein